MQYLSRYGVLLQVFVWASNNATFLFPDATTDRWYSLTPRWMMTHVEATHDAFDSFFRYRDTFTGFLSSVGYAYGMSLFTYSQFNETLLRVKQSCQFFIYLRYFYGSIDSDALTTRCIVIAIRVSLQLMLIMCHFIVINATLGRKLSAL